MARHIITVFILLATLGCSRKDNCNDSCLNGSCIRDSCACHTGYTGKWCQTYVGGAVSSSSGSSSTGSSSGNVGPSSSTSASGNGGPGFTFIFWKDFDGPPVHVTLWANSPGAPVKDITKHYPSVTACDAEGCAMFDIGYIRSGIIYKATDGVYNWQDTIGYLEPCTKIKLEKP